MVMSLSNIWTYTKQFKDLVPFNLIGIPFLTAPLTDMQLNDRYMEYREVEVDSYCLNFIKIS